MGIKSSADFNLAHDNLFDYIDRNCEIADLSEADQKNLLNCFLYLSTRLMMVSYMLDDVMDKSFKDPEAYHKSFVKDFVSDCLHMGKTFGQYLASPGAFIESNMDDIVLHNLKKFKEEKKAEDAALEKEASEMADNVIHKLFKK